MRMGQSKSLPLGDPAVSRLIAGGRGRVVRLSVRETSGTNPAAFDVYDGDGPTGTLIDSVSLSAGQSTRDYYRDWEYPFDGGLYLDVISGTFKGTYVVQYHREGDVWGMPVIIVASDVGIVELPPSQ